MLTSRKRLRNQFSRPLRNRAEPWPAAHIRIPSHLLTKSPPPRRAGGFSRIDLTGATARIYFQHM